MRLLILTWRDEWHPEAGGSERMIGEVVRGLVRRGHAVEVATAAYPGRPRVEEVDGVRYHRAGSRLSVYPHGFLRALRGRQDVVVDVQNGVPFFAAALGRRSLLLVHHVHREQWPVAVGPLAAKVGWFVESRLSPWVHRRTRVLAVSHATARELASLGHPSDAVDVVVNGCDLPASLTSTGPARNLVVVSRLVPHKQVDHAIRAVADLAPRHRDLTLTVVGTGYHRQALRALAEQLGVAHRVRFVGYVSDAERDEALGRAWVHLLPSVKEGWGLVAVEAAASGTPTVAYRSAGGVTESVVDGVTGLLVDDYGGFVRAVDRLLSDRELVDHMGLEGRLHATSLSWKSTVDGFEECCERVVGLPRHG
jgi:glycosyltransferase involved in cell wall biosynthesis